MKRASVSSASPTAGRFRPPLRADAGPAPAEDADQPQDSGCVHVVEDDAAVCASLAFILECAGYKARLYGSAEAFLEAVDYATAGCVVTDLRLGRMDGLELAVRLRAMGVRLPVIIVTGHAEVALAVEAMKGGVVDFLEKPVDDKRLLEAVASALGDARRAAEEDAERRRFAAQFGDLSVREREVLQRLVEGRSNKEIARDLGISHRTVEVYRAQVMRKTGSQSLSELVRAAIRGDVARGG